MVFFILVPLARPGYPTARGCGPHALPFLFNEDHVPFAFVLLIGPRRAPPTRSAPSPYVTRDVLAAPVLLTAHVPEVLPPATARLRDTPAGVKLPSASWRMGATSNGI